MSGGVFTDEDKLPHAVIPSAKVKNKFLLMKNNKPAFVGMVQCRVQSGPGGLPPNQNIKTESLEFMKAARKMLCCFSLLYNAAIIQPCNKFSERVGFHCPCF